MSLTLAALVSRLQADVPQRGSVPSATQYADCVKDAVADYSRRRPMLRRATIDVRSGVAEYGLPDDFWQLVSFQVWGPSSGVMVTDGGLVPLPGDFREEWEILGRTLVLHPTPGYTMSGRVLRYLAVHVPSVVEGEGDEEDVELYAYLTREDEAIFAKRAQALALGLIANTMATKVADTAVRDVRETRSAPLKEVREQIQALEAEYEAKLERANKVLPVLGHGYSQAELEAWL